MDKSNKNFLFSLPLRSKEYDIREQLSNLLQSESHDFLEQVKVDNHRSTLNFQVDKRYFIKGLIQSLRNEIRAPDYLCDKPNNIIVEYSSPNIAKPFHVGHLRSTIIGNCIANINQYLKNNVKRLNYLGDWGTQFGFVQLGLTLSKVSEETLKRDPITALYNAYVYANKLAEEDPSIAEQARDIFKKLESGDKNDFSGWKSFREYTIQELERTYGRIGIKFDEYEWESMYNIKSIQNVITEMKRLNLLVTDDKNRTVIPLTEKKAVPIIKSDGSSLYITRDIAAAIERYQKYQFDAMYYVVDNAQTDHFVNLIGILNTMKLPWANKLKHIKFGKIQGMSTRKGTAVFLQDILDETRIVMKEKQIQSPSMFHLLSITYNNIFKINNLKNVFIFLATKVNLDYDDPSTEILGVSAIIINDLKYKRTQDYKFDWNKALDVR